MSELTYWVNGDFVPASQAMVPLTSRGYRMGDGVFDTERTFNGKLFKLDAHLARLEKSLRFTRIDPGMSMAELGRISEETLGKNLHLLEEHGDFWVTQTISRGAGRNLLESGTAFVSVIVEPLPFARFAPFYGQGVHLVAPAARTSAVSGMDPKLKATSRLGMVLADLESKQTDPDALTLLLDEQGNLAEVIYGNLFLVRDGKIRTPGGRAILEGVTRATTMELARGAGLAVSECELQPYDLYTADEAFVSTTSYCVLPVGSLNGSPVGKEVPGPLTRRISEEWNKLAGLDIAEQMHSYAARAQAAAQPATAARG
ncbi:MAG: aminotransferase class IV [SAR324 cluster bacterium]|nr:aminotransferase class IV [SAR324 cluster bacterium]